MNDQLRKSQYRILKSLWIIFVPGLIGCGAVLGFIIGKILLLSLSATAIYAEIGLGLVSLVGAVLYRKAAFRKLQAISDPDLREVAKAGEFLANVGPWIAAGIMAIIAVSLSMLTGQLLLLFGLVLWLPIHLLVLRPKFAWD